MVLSLHPLFKRIRALFSPSQPNEGRSFRLGDPDAPPAPAPGEAGEREEPRRRLSTDLDKNLGVLRRAFSYPLNSDIIHREFELGWRKPRRAGLFMIEGLARSDAVTDAILNPMLLWSSDAVDRVAPRRLASFIADRLVGHADVRLVRTFEEVIDLILVGNTAILVDGSAEAIVVETKGWEHRAPERPNTEGTTRGSQQGFAESHRANTALIRRLLRTPDLIFERIIVGRLSRTDVALIYVEGLTNPQLVGEVRRRLAAIKDRIDHVPEAGRIEQLIWDRHSSLLPLSYATERPDRVAAALTEGHFAILVGDSPFVIIGPVTFVQFVHNPEEHYLPWGVGTFMRLIRVLGVTLSLFVPALYLAVANYHHEMLPTPLLFSIAASREQVPFPIPFEIVIMELSFELIREAGTRIPTVIGGPTIGIVGAIILGQAAVSAGIVSPILILVIAVTGLGSFSIPNYSLSFSIRVMRFFLVIASAALGFFGIALVATLILGYLASIRSFGVPFLAPVAPWSPESHDIIVRGPIWIQEERPGFLRPIDRFRQKAIVRVWELKRRYVGGGVDWDEQGSGRSE